MANPPPDPTISSIRRKLISAAAPPDAASPADQRSETIDFDFVSENGVAPSGLDQLMRPATPAGYDDVEALLERYQAEKGLAPAAPDMSSPTPNGARRQTLPELRMPAGSSHDVRRPGPGKLPPLTTAANAELERLRAENVELRQLVNEYREVLEANDPTVWEQKVAEATQAVAEKDEQLQAMSKNVEEWNEKFKTHRFVPHDNELAQEADELDKERAKLAQDRKQLDGDREQLKEDEEALMKQMREMEMGMARDRADIARQRTELQRLHTDIKHEMEVMSRGDASVKERLSQFQRRYQDTMMRPAGPPQAQPAPAPAAAPPPTASPTPKPRDSGVFKKLFGQGR